MKKLNKSMLEGPLFPSIIRYSIPIILTSLLQLLFHAADMVVVGRFCGSVSVAAVGSTGNLIALIVNLFIGISLGASVSVAHAIGSKEDDVVFKVVHTAIPTALISGLILTVVGLLFSEKFLILMRTPENVLPLSTVYLKIYFAGIIFNMLYNFCSAILRSAGDSQSPLVLLLISGILNVLLNLAFVILFDMNVAGVALATVISQAVSAVLVMIVLMRRTDACKLYLRKIRIYIPQFLRILRIGIPAGINSSLFAVSNVIIQSSINSFGDVLMAGNAAAASIEGFVSAIMSAFYQAAVNFVGQNHGAHQYKRVRKTYKICLACSAVSGLVAGAIAYIFAPKLLSFYITDSQEAISYGVLRMTFICLLYFIAGIMDVTEGSIRGLGVSIAPMFISLVGICGIRIVSIFTLFQMEQFHKPQFLYSMYPISWIVTLTVDAILFESLLRKNEKKYKIE